MFRREPNSQFQVNVETFGENALLGRMEIALNIPHGERQQDFLDYLNAALRRRLSSFTGSAGINKNGLFESTVIGPFSIDQRIINLSWSIKRDAKGTLLSVAVDSLDPGVSEENWKTAVHEFITSVLATALAQSRKKYFRQSFFYYIGAQLDGEYWLPRCRFAPAYPADPDPHLINAERIVSIDQEVDAVDESHAWALADEAARRHAARLTLLLNIGLHGVERTLRWVWPVVDGKPATESVRYQLGFEHPTARLSEMPEKGEQCPLGAYKGSLAARYRIAGELLSLPVQARSILRGIDDVDHPLVANAFDCGARLYQVAAVCGRFFPSVGLAYRVAAVEAVCQADDTSKGFSDFMRKYVTSQGDLDKILDYLYGVVRSSHFHAGQFPMGEFQRRSFFDPLMDADTVQRGSLHRTCYELTREAIVNWLETLIPDTANIGKDDVKRDGTCSYSGAVASGEPR